ncbi:ABC transporter permease [Chungangia koreensis]|uniref:ABC transporter permease n=1 Tax=Chungangia koreensis TaxID=752657 RepID=A0ABV8XC40_9LACT
MIWSLIWKEFKLFIRNPQELLVLLLMPLILITILGFALNSFFTEEASPVTGKVALVQNGDEEKEFERFMQSLSDSPIPEPAIRQIEGQVKGILPIQMLRERIFGNEELSKVIALEEITPAQISDAKDDGEYSAIIEVPEGFTENLLHSLFIEEREVPGLIVYENEEKDYSSAFVSDVVEQFKEQYSLMASLGREGLVVEEEPLGGMGVAGAIETVTKQEPIGAFSYYAVGMSVMFVLFLAGNISTNSYMEKQQHVYDRIRLANVPSTFYLLGVFLSGFALAVIQLCILYGGAAFMYDVHWTNIGEFLVITLSLSSVVASIGVLLTVINQRIGSDSASKLYGNAGVAILAFLGGSFTQVGNISETIQVIGNLTPNGAAMTAYLNVLQGAVLPDILVYVWTLLIETIVILTIASLFSKRKAVRA